MSSGLSNSCETAMGLARDYDGKVQVVDNQRISVTQYQSVVDALALRDTGKSAAEIKEVLEAEKLESSIYITLETLKYLKKRRTDYSCCSCHRNSSEFKTSTSDSGREAGCLCQSKG